MTFSVLCFSCGKVLGNKGDRYYALRSQKVSAKDALDQLGIKRICCRRMCISHVDVEDKLLTMSIFQEDAMRDIPISWLPRPLKRKEPNQCVAR
jgi:DNA-directed RNA polymerase subunit N (RpoN/RPB10)